MSWCRVSWCTLRACRAQQQHTRRFLLQLAPVFVSKINVDGVTLDVDASDRGGDIHPARRMSLRLLSIPNLVFPTVVTVFDRLGYKLHASSSRPALRYLAVIKTHFRSRNGLAPGSPSGAVIVSSSTLRCCSVRHKASRRTKGSCCLSRLAKFTRSADGMVERREPSRDHVAL